MYNLEFDLCKDCHNINICYGAMSMLHHTKDELLKYNSCHHYYSESEFIEDRKYVNEHPKEIKEGIEKLNKLLEI